MMCDEEIANFFFDKSIVTSNSIKFFNDESLSSHFGPSGSLKYDLLSFGLRLRYCQDKTLFSLLDFDIKDLFDEETLSNFTKDGINLNDLMSRCDFDCDFGIKYMKVSYLRLGIFCCENWIFLSRNDLNKFAILYGLSVDKPDIDKVLDIISIQNEMLTYFRKRSNKIIKDDHFEKLFQELPCKRMKTTKSANN